MPMPLSLASHPELGAFDRVDKKFESRFQPVRLVETESMTHRLKSAVHMMERST